VSKEQECQGVVLHGGVKFVGLDRAGGREAARGREAAGGREMPNARQLCRRGSPSLRPDRQPKPPITGTLVGPRPGARLTRLRVGLRQSKPLGLTQAPRDRGLELPAGFGARGPAPRRTRVSLSWCSGIQSMGHPCVSRRRGALCGVTDGGRYATLQGLGGNGAAAELHTIGGTPRTSRPPSRITHKSDYAQTGTRDGWRAPAQR